MKLKNKIILSILFIGIVLLILISGKVIARSENLDIDVGAMAWNNGNEGHTKHITYPDLRDKYKNLFCIEIGQRVWSSGKDYKLLDHIHIENMTATSKQSGRSYTDLTNLELAYALGAKDRGYKNTYEATTLNSVPTPHWIPTYSEGVKFSDGTYLIGRANQPTHIGDNAMQTFIWGWFQYWYREINANGTEGIGRYLSDYDLTIVSEWDTNPDQDSMKYKTYLGRFCYLRDMIVVPEAKVIYNEIKNQNSITDGTSNPSVSNEIKTVNGKQYIAVGPFYVSNVPSSGVTNFVVRDQNNQPINGALVYSGGEYKPASGAVSNIQSNRSFDIYIPVDSGVTYLKDMTLTKNITTYNLTADLYFLQSTDSAWQNMLVADGTYDKKTDTPSTVTFTYNIPLTGNINLEKIDADKENPMSGVGFKFRNTNNGQWVQNISGKIAYTSNENSATVFYTNNDGKLSVKGVLVGQYEAKEVDLSDTDDDYYDLLILNPSFTVNPGDTTTVNVKVENKRKYVDLSGKVWEEMEYVTKGYKENSYENLYSDEDKLMQNVRVYLRRTDSNTNYMEPVYTNESGYYEFRKVEIDALPSLYVEFEYNGMVYESVPVVDLKNANSSKSAETSREEFNEKFEQIEKDRAVNGDIELTYDTKQNTNEGEEEQTSTINYGEDLKYGWKDEKNSGNPENTNSPVYGGDSNYWTMSNTHEVENKYIGQYEGYTPDDIRNAGTTMIENLNLGLKRREQPDLAVSNELYSAKLIVPTTDGTEEHIYNYSDRNNKDLLADIEQGVTNPAVQWGRLNLPTSYTRALYASDIAKGHEEGSLELYVTYKLSIINQSTSLIATIDTITDYFDNKYEGHGFTIGKTIDDKSNVGNAIGGITSSQVAGISYNRTSQIEVNEKINPNSSVDLYLQFKVENDEIIKLLGDGDQYAEEVKLDNIIEITKYSTSTKDGAAYAGIDKDSAPENFNLERHISDEEEYVENMSNYEDDTSRAPGLKLVLSDPRSTDGTVFLDEKNKATGDKTTGDLATGEVREGDGEYSQGEEAGINEVLVTMYEVDENGNKTNIAEYYDNNDKEWKPAQMKTANINNQDGGYQFSGYIPGNYIIEYDWGGEEVKTSEGNEITLRVQDYKSTIVDETRWNNKQANERWYVTENTEETRYSDAVDNYAKRQEIDEETKEVTYGLKQKIENAYKEGSSQISTKMDSYTPKFKIDIEYNNADGVTNLADVYEMNENGTPKVENGEVVLKEGYKNELKNIDFGIVERARQQLKLDKYISTAKVTLANGTTIIDAVLDENGNIVNKDEVNYAIGLEETTLTRKLLKIEIDDEIVQGSTLSVQYNYKVTNQSELDYTTQEFYMYGSAKMGNDSQKVQLTPSLIDYIDNDLVIEETTFASNGWKLLTNTDKENYTTEGIDQLLTKNLKEYIGGIQNISVNESNSTLQNMVAGEAREIQLNGSRLVSTTLDGTQIENDAEIIKVEKTGGSTLTTMPGNYEPTEWQKTTEVDDSRADLIIINETGLTTDIIAYVTLTISSLGILVAGIILIKKFVL